MITLIVLADRAEARFYQRTSLVEPLQLIRTLKNPSGKLQNQEMDSDRPGVVRGKFGSTMSPYIREQDSKDRSLEMFMHTIAEQLSKDDNEGEFDFLIISAEPKVLGALRPLLPDRVARRVIGSFDKELTRMDERTLKDYFREVRPPVGQ